MNAKLFSSTLVLAGILLWAGCESSRYEPASGLSGAPPALPPAQPPSTETEILTRAAAQPMLPPEGQGWRTLFDGESLKGWRVTEFDQGGKVEVR
ncbi:MAG TPA: hypothetical protein VFZ59_28140, partial [Verrucomicrobiae bacterium]|nr:hypothetical protein [Verrucomicrobiae bacterium]